MKGEGPISQLRGVRVGRSEQAARDSAARACAAPLLLPPCHLSHLQPPDMFNACRVSDGKHEQKYENAVFHDAGTVGR